MAAKGILLGLLFVGIANIIVRLVTAHVEPYSFRANVNHAEITSTFKRLEENAPTLVKLLQAICEVLLAGLWILDTSLNAFLWLLNETVSSCTEFCIRVFSVLFNIVKLLETFGFVIKFLLELNYAVLSYIFDTFGCIKASIHDAVTLVKMTIANRTYHMYESSSMAIEGVQTLVFAACNQTWVKVQYVSSVVTTNVTPPFGLSAWDLSVSGAIFMAGFQFFIESIKMSSQLFRDECLFLFNYFYGTLFNMFDTTSKIILGIVCCIQDIFTLVIGQIVYIARLPFYFMANLVSNTLNMLYFTWESFVNWVSYVNSLFCNVVYAISLSIGCGLSSIASGIFRGLYGLIGMFIGHLSGLVDVITATLSNIFNSLTGFINLYEPGGLIITIVLGVVLIILFHWNNEIKLFLASSWISIQQMNENSRGTVDEYDEAFDGDTDFEIERDARIPEPALDKGFSQDQTKLSYELECEKDKRLCVICQDNVKNILLMPCRHVCMCQQCVLAIEQDHVQLVQCPLCRTPIQTILEVFV